MNKSNLNIKNKTPESVVEVKDLKVQFQLKDKVVKAVDGISFKINKGETCLLYTSPSPRDFEASRMPSSA